MKWLERLFCRLTGKRIDRDLIRYGEAYVLRLEGSGGYRLKTVITAAEAVACDGVGDLEKLISTKARGLTAIMDQQLRLYGPKPFKTEIVEQP